MKIRKTIPPAAAPISLTDLVYGIYGLVKKNVRKKLEEEIKEYFDTKYVFLVSSGKAALFIILSALKKMNGRSKVIIPAYTCYSVPSAVKKADLEIVPCDVLPDTLDYDFEQLEKLADNTTLCIVSTHLFGIPSDVERIKTLCKDKNIIVVEDAAQAFGVTHCGRKLGTVGDVSFYSFGRGKNITCGSGGMIITSSEDIAWNIRKYHDRLAEDPPAMFMKQMFEVFLMYLFIKPYLYWIPRGLPFLKIGETQYSIDFPVCDFNGFKAGLLFHWKKKLTDYNSFREDVSVFYKNEIKIIRSQQLQINGIPYLRFPVYGKSEENKEAICQLYGHFGISSMYPDSINNIHELKEILSRYSCGNAETIAKKLLTLPTHTMMSRIDLSRICELLNNTQ